MTQGFHLVVGGFAPSGVCVHDFFGDYGSDYEDIGVAALRKF